MGNTDDAIIRKISDGQHPTLGRFTQPDPTGQDPHYTYARNNPVNFIDPSGAGILAAVAGYAAGLGVGVTCEVTVILATGGTASAPGAYFCSLAGAATGAFISDRATANGY